MVIVVGTKVMFKCEDMSFVVDIDGKFEVEISSKVEGAIELEDILDEDVNDVNW